ncbi:pH-response regulator protein palH/rim21, partial [Teratosphaeriaceae sp. CCFEE 6253]
MGGADLGEGAETTKGAVVTSPHFPLGRAHSSTTSGQTPDPATAMNGNGRVAFGRLPKPRDEVPSEIPVLGQPTPPPPVASPVSRADTASAASTVYVVRYDTAAADVPQPVRRRVARDANGNTAGALVQADAQRRQSAARDPEKEEVPNAEDEAQPNRNRKQGRWYGVSNPFKRKRASPPAEVQQARRAAAATSYTPRAVKPAHNFPPRDVKNRLGVLAAETGERFRDGAVRRRPYVDVPVTVIPAQPRGSGRTWSPEVHTQQQQRVTTAQRQPDASEGAVFRSATAAIDDVPQASQGANSVSPLGAGGTRNSWTVVSAPSRGSNPPRADDISPVGGSSSRPIVVPALRRSPLRITTPAQGSEGRTSDDTGADGSARGGGNG